jgi:Rrf2 family protein
VNVSTRFTVALHILTLLASSPNQALTSAYIAGSVNTNPVVIRRLLGLLRRAGFVSSQGGAGGGWKLARAAEFITLASVRRAVNESSPFSLHSQPPNPACPVGRNIQGALLGIYGEAERALEDRLARTTVHELLRSVEACQKQRRKRKME